MTEKEVATLYYKQEEIVGDVKSSLQKTREEPGISLQSVGNVIKQVLDKSEVQILISELGKGRPHQRDKN